MLVFVLYTYVDFLQLQILEVNNHNFEHISHNRALEILRGTTHLAITVKSNLLGEFFHLAFFVKCVLECR